MGHNFKDINPELCNYCGTCVGICPTEAIQATDERLSFSAEKCIQCGACYSACPGIEVDFQGLNSMTFGEAQNDEIIGVHKGIYIARSKDKNILKNGSSGGAVTSILVYLLKKQYIDGAIVMKMDPKIPYKPMAVIAKTEKELLSSQGSKYTMYPLNSILRHIGKDDKKYAYVGLPCHIHGIRKLQKQNNLAATKITYIIGLFCGFNAQAEGTAFFIKKCGHSLKDVKGLKYRAGKWPGGLEITTRAEKRSFLPKYYYDITDAVFIPRRCLLCIDYMAELSDISIGDIYLSDLKREKWSCVISRSDKGHNLLSKTSDTIEYRKIPQEKLTESHHHNIMHKKKGAFFRMSVRKHKPIYDVNVPKLTVWEKIKLSVPTIIFWTTRQKTVRMMLNLIPLKMMGAIAYARRRLAKKTI